MFLFITVPTLHRDCFGIVIILCCVSCVTFRVFLRRIPQKGNPFGNYACFLLIATNAAIIATIAKSAAASPATYGIGVESSPVITGGFSG